MKNSIRAKYLTCEDACKVLLHFASFCNILLNFGSLNDGCKLPSSLPHEWLVEWKEQYIAKTEWKNLLAQILKAYAKLCSILQVSAIYCSTLAAIIMAVSFPHHCKWVAGWVERAVYYRNWMKNSIRTKYLTCEDACKALLHFASFCNILLNFGSHNDGCNLPSSLHMSGWLSGKSSIL